MAWVQAFLTPVPITKISLDQISMVDDVQIAKAEARDCSIGIRLLVAEPISLVLGGSSSRTGPIQYF